MLLYGHPRHVTVTTLHKLSVALEVALDVRDLQLAVVCNTGAELLPLAVDQSGIGFACRRGHVVAQEGFHCRFELTDAKHVDADGQLLQRFMHKQVIGFEARETDVSHGIHEDAVCERSQVVLILGVAVALCPHLLAGRSEAQQRTANGIQLGSVGSGEQIELQDNGLDAAVLRCRIDSLDDFMQHRLICDTAVEQCGERSRGRAVLYERPLERQH